MEQPSINSGCQSVIDYLHKLTTRLNHPDTGYEILWGGLPDIPLEEHEVILNKLQEDECVRLNKFSLSLLPLGSEYSVSKKYVVKNEKEMNELIASEYQLKNEKWKYVTRIIIMAIAVVTLIMAYLTYRIYSR